MNSQIGESTITPQVQAQVVPEMNQPQGKQELANNLAKTVTQKKFLDFIFKGIADKVGVDFSSRIKNPETIVKKIAQKRIEGRDYKLNDVNDTFGGRFIIKDKNQINNISNMLKKAEELGIFKINKQEEVTKDTYHAHHLDFETPEGTKGEIQLMSPQEELESVANHSLRSTYGENTKGAVDELKNKQADIAKKIPDNKAHSISQTIQQISKQNNDQPVDPRIIAQALSQR